jgi:serine/threonine protein kinase
MTVVRRSELVPEDRLDAAYDRLTTGSHTCPATVDAMAQALIAAGVLTKFQARQLKLGRYKRFQIGGKYRLMELLGVGGMGAVYLCEHVFMKRLVALKVLPQEKMTDPGNVERFYREARAVAALNDPNIVRAYDLDQSEGLHFLVMEYVDGASLQEIVARFGPLDPVRAASYIAQAANGLQHACELSMVHRDVKPANLLLDRTGVVKILDMGLARFFADKQDNLTAKFDEKCVLGTADYLAPEQAMTNEVDTRADIYALGGTLYFLLTGNSPVPDGTIAQKLVFHQTKDPVPVEQVRPDLPDGLPQIVRKMMMKDPARRYQTPAEVAEALAPWADPYLPPPPAHEMPELCPAVLALAGHFADRAKVSSSSGRLSGPGRLVQSRSGAGTRTATGGPDTPTGASRVELAGAPTEVHVETEPIPPTPSKAGPDNGSDARIDIVHPDPGDPVAGLPAGRPKVANTVTIPTWAAGTVIGVLSVLAVGAGLYAAFSNRPKPSVNPPAAQQPAAGGPTQASAPVILTPEQARYHVGENRTVQFAVARVGSDGNRNVFLNSKEKYRDPDNFYVFLPSNMLRQQKLTPDEAKKMYEGNVVRVRGPIQRWQERDVQIEVADLSQVEIVRPGP